MAANLDSTPGLNQHAWDYSPNTFNGLPILLPIPFVLERSSGWVFALCGEAIDVRLVNMSHNNPQDELTIGTDVWKLFPMLVNNHAGLNVYNSASTSSFPYGIAYRKNA